MDATTIISGISLIVSISALIVSKMSANQAKRAASASERSAIATEKSVVASERSASASEKSVSTNIQIFKRQGVIALYGEWHDINAIDSSRPITPDVVKAVNALELTASLWNHDAIEKEILYQSFWEDYKEIYDKLKNSDTQVPGLNKTLRQLLTRPVVKAYQEMEAFDLATVRQSTIQP
jgi:hypothetical protein